MGVQIPMGRGNFEREGASHCEVYGHSAVRPLCENCKYFSSSCLLELFAKSRFCTNTLHGAYYAVVHLCLYILNELRCPYVSLRTTYYVRYYGAMSSRMCLCLHLRKISRFCQLLCILSLNNVDLHVFELWNIVASSI